MKRLLSSSSLLAQTLAVLLPVLLVWPMTAFSDSLPIADAVHCCDIVVNEAEDCESEGADLCPWHNCLQCPACHPVPTPPSAIIPATYHFRTLPVHLQILPEPRSKIASLEEAPPVPPPQFV